MAKRASQAGERAMAVAMLFPDPEKGGRGNKRKVADSAMFSQRRLREARQVLRHSPELAKAVRDGITKLDTALEQVKAEQQRLATAEEQLKELQDEAPDLAEMVKEERLEIGEAVTVLQQRTETDRERRRLKRVGEPGVHMMPGFK